jgi:D-tyrosyl-tRNA(Tyr) deacylase
MRAVLQRVVEGSVEWDGGRQAIGPGYLVLLGVARGDEQEDADQLAEKIVRLRIFSDQQRKFNLDAQQVGAEILVVSQFTLFANARGQNRPSFLDAAPPEQAIRLVQRFVAQLTGKGLTVRQGSFGAQMRVGLVNDGPVTVVLSTDPWDPQLGRPARRGTPIAGSTG